MRYRHRTLIGVLLFGLSIPPALAGASTVQSRPPLASEPVDMETQLSDAQNMTEVHPRLDAAGVLTLNEALAFAVRHSPRLVAQTLTVRSRRAQRRQAGLRANPEIEVEVENVGGRGEAREFSAAETTLQLSQSLDPAGKRGKREQVASREVDLAEWELNIVRLDLITEVRQRFVEVLAAQERVTLYAELARLHETTLTAVGERVDAGKSAPAEEARARIDLAGANIQRERARRALAAARHRLAATWGDSTPNFTSVAGDFYSLTPPRADVPPAELAAQNPDVAWQALATELREATVRLERANRLPELTLSGGVRHFNDTGDVSFVMGLSVPLPLFHRNQGAVQAAEFDLAAIETGRRATKASVHASIVEAMQNLSTAHHAVNELAGIIVPDSERVFTATLEGYRTGKFAYLTVLDAQRTLFQARGEHVDALEEYHRAQAELERLIGSDLDLPASSGIGAGLRSPEGGDKQ